MAGTELARKLTTILSADAAEYSRMMRADEEGTFRALRLCRDAIDGLVQEHQGRVFGSAGDSVVAEFASPVEALRCATAIQQRVEAIDLALPAASRMKFRIGINLGDVLVQGDDLIGDGVNVANRIQTFCQPGAICISASVHEIIRSKPEFVCEDLGPVTVKNISEPIRVYRVRPVSGDRAIAAKLPRRSLRAAAMALWAAAIVALLAGGLGLAFYSGLLTLPGTEGGPQLASPTVRQASIAVLPFENLSGDAAQDYFADGITEDMTLALGRFSDLSVVAPEAVRHYKGKAFKPGELARDLGIRYVLQGSVRRDGDRVRVTATLSDAMTGVQLWSDRYDGEVKDVFAVQDDITHEVVGTLAIKLSTIERQRSLAKPPENLPAYDYLQRGREFLRRNTRADTREARRLFEQAIALDPSYASAYVALARTRLLTATSGWTELMVEYLDEAERLAHKALELDSNNAGAHAVLAEIYLGRQQYDLARAENEQAIALNPNDAASYAARGAVLTFSGEPEEAVRSFEIATRLDPSVAIIRHYSIGWPYYLVRRYDEAAQWAEAGIRQNPADYFNPACLAASYAQLGRMEDADRAASATLRAWPFFHVDTFVSQFRREADRALIAEGLRKAGLR
ncbi:adenylate/guanylate cyclase domain-containing protein [Dongia deserti]|uniref:adenylate/guanylate cyclase domain-containing protein n=1 Tax=Dongia deserti TaxID=2268030 RepID=UPI0013C51AB0|nr:adenylate/guanylate cyclase domain-containing protein [Dongia deserti]